jgi:hypothetical protein
MDYIDINISLPEKGLSVIGVDIDDILYNCYRCDCHLTNCGEWIDIQTGMRITKRIIKFKYI